MRKRRQGVGRARLQHTQPVASSVLQTRTFRGDSKTSAPCRGLRVPMCRRRKDPEIRRVGPVKSRFRRQPLRCASRGGGFRFANTAVCGTAYEEQRMPPTGRKKNTGAGPDCPTRPGKVAGVIRHIPEGKAKALLGPRDWASHRNLAPFLAPITGPKPLERVAGVDIPAYLILSPWGRPGLFMMTYASRFFPWAGERGNRTGLDNLATEAQADPRAEMAL